MQFSTNLTALMNGRRVNMEEWNTITRVLEGASNLGFGRPVQRGTNPKQCVEFTSGDFLGVTEASQVLPHPGDYYSQYDNVAICESGVIGVIAGGTVTHGTPAGWDATANSGAGGWVAATTVIPQVPGCEFDSNGGTGTVVALRVRRPVIAS